jgi:serine phosphatase RsbU (regulator of sigma subunit)/anti-anti-sigma regulatory factor
MADLRILIVDDEDLILHVLKEFFRQRHDQCDTASNGMEALRLVEDRLYDLVLSDISMPGMDGLELIRRVKSLQPHSVCILMSGLGTRRDILSALKIGVFDFIDKPIPDLASLTMVIDRATESSKLVHERDALLENLKQQNAKLEYSLQRLHEAFGQLRRQEEILESDLARAQRVQRKFLPSAFPRLNGLDFFGYYAPCEQLGGDFFGMIPLSENRLAIYLVDVAGHGVSAAMVTVTFRELMRARLREKDSGRFFQSPGQVLEYLNGALLEESFDPPIFVSMVYAVLDPVSGRVRLASAGHPAPILAAAESTRIELTSGCVLGSQNPTAFEEKELQLQVGDVLLFYSDGLSEARNGEGKEFTIDRLEELAQQHRLSGAAETGHDVETALSRHVEGVACADDVTFIVATRTAATIPSSENVPTSADLMVPDSVRIVMPEKIRHALTNTNGVVTAGWHETICVIRLSGLATWPLAPAMREMISMGKERSRDPLHVDIADCEAMDSTILGLLLQHASEMVLHQPVKRVVSQMHEMGLLSLFNISNEACFIPDTSMDVTPNATQQAASEIILSAHEALMEASESNRQRFKGVVDTLKSKAENEGKKGSG